MAHWISLTFCNECKRFLIQINDIFAGIIRCPGINHHHHQAFTPKIGTTTKRNHN
jgi:hypothetical protein